MELAEADMTDSLAGRVIELALSVCREGGLALGVVSVKSRVVSKMHTYSTTGKALKSGDHEQRGAGNISS